MRVAIAQVIVGAFLLIGIAPSAGAAPSALTCAFRNNNTVDKLLPNLPVEVPPVQLPPVALPPTPVNVQVPAVPAVAPELPVTVTLPPVTVPKLLP